MKITISSPTSEIEIDLSKSGVVSVFNHEPELEGDQLEGKLGKLVDRMTGLVSAVAVAPEPKQPAPFKRKRR